MLVHLNDVARRNDLRVPWQRAVSRLVDPFGPSDEDDRVVGMGPGVIEGSRDDLGRAVIAAHGIDRDADRAHLGRGCRRHGRGRQVPGVDSPAGFSSTASRPLYQPQLGQTWWGRFG
jgi:hypothetical protein